MAKAAKPTKTGKSQKSPDQPDDPEIEVETENGEDEPETPPETTPPAEGAADEPDPPPAGSSAVTVAGSGTLSIMADGIANTVERGKKIKVSAELLEALKAHGETVEESKK
jgi:hypothetical protein